VERVSWHDAIEFCRRLSERSGRHYSLPSEAQWEYACRAATTTPFHFGTKPTIDLANYYDSGTYWGDFVEERRLRTTLVGMFPVNDCSLHDLHGNV
jgi:formylglycine-generating enzyme required for sulfatase activity